jgi:hypothetical protein
MRALFLDIDGTMFRLAAVPASGRELDDQVPAFAPEAVQALNVILRRTKARVVIASDRAVLGRRRIEELLIRNGVTATLHDDWRTTPLSSSTQASEITWLASTISRVFPVASSPWQELARHECPSPRGSGAAIGRVSRAKAYAVVPGILDFLTAIYGIIPSYGMTV